MNKKLLLAGILRTMSRYKLRTFFMGFGVAVGVATLVVSRSLGVGAEAQMMEKVNRMFGSNSIMVRASARPGGTEPTLELADLEAIGERLDQVDVWDPMHVMGGREVKYQAESRQVTIWAHSERAELVWGRGVVEGETFTKADVASAARVALLGTRLAEDLFGNESPVGEQVLIGSVPFRVKGVLEPIGIDPHGMDRDKDVHVPISTAMRRLLNVDYIAMAKLLVHDPENVEQTADDIAEILRERHFIAEGQPDDFAIFTPRFVQGMVSRANRVLKLFLPAAAGVALLVAAIVIANVMLISVRGRISEVGLRRAVGATERQISVQFLTEALGISLLSGLAGVALGVAVVLVLTRMLRLATILTADSILIGLAAALAVGLLSGLLPARQAARLDPVEALR